VQRLVAASGNAFPGGHLDGDLVSGENRSMPDIIVKPRVTLKPLDPKLRAEVLKWATELRVIWVATGLTLGQFASLHPVDKGTISRYLNGERVPRDHWFLDRLLAIRADRGEPVTPAVCEHLTKLHLRALEAAHPHEYKVRLVQDELEIALTGKLEAERYAHGLEEQLVKRNREIQRLTKDKKLLRASWNAEYERLTTEIGKLTRKLRMAEEWAAQAGQRCAQLEDVLEELESLTSTDTGNGPSRPWSKSSFGFANGNGLEIRDSTDPDGPILTFSSEAWNDFIGTVRQGKLDPPVKRP
jgi:hypothetical protein